MSILRGVVEQLATVAGFSEKDCRSITLAIDEACTNIIRHAYECRDDGRIELLCREHDDRVEFILTDYGRPVDLARLRSRSLDEVREGGLGTHLIAFAMDQVEYDRVNNANQLRLVKYRTNRKPEE